MQREILADYDDAGTTRSQYALIARTALAESLRRSGRLQEALKEVHEAHAALLEEAGESALYTLSARMTLAAVLSDLNRLDEALSASEETMRIAELELGESSQYTDMFRLRHGKILTLIGRFEDAEKELIGAQARLLDRHTARGPNTLRAGRFLAELYEAWGREESAAEWRAIINAPVGKPVEASASTESE